MYLAPKRKRISYLFFSGAFAGMVKADTALYLAYNFLCLFREKEILPKCRTIVCCRFSSVPLIKMFNFNPGDIFSFLYGGCFFSSKNQKVQLTKLIVGPALCISISI